MPDLNIIRIKSRQEFQQYEKPWEQLYQACAQHQATARHGLVSAFWQAFLPDRPVEILALAERETGDWVAAFPLGWHKLMRLMPHAKSFSNPWSLGFVGLLSSRWDSRQLQPHLQAALAAVGQPMLTWDFVSDENPVAQRLLTSDLLPHASIECVDLFPVGKTILTATWDEFISDWSKKRRRFIRRASEQLREHGDYRMVPLHAGSLAEAQAAWETCLQIESRGWKGQDGSDIGSNPPARQYYDEVLRQLHPTGELRFYVLELNGQAIAYDFGYLHQRVATSLKVSYDPDFAPYSPGHVLNSLVIQDLIQQQEADWIDTVGELNEANSKWCRESYRCQRLEIGLPGGWSQHAVKSRAWLRAWKHRWDQRRGDTVQPTRVTLDETSEA